MKVKITITKTDMLKTAQAMQSGKGIAPSQCCPVFQSFKRRKFNVESVCRNFYGVSYYVMLKNKRERKSFNLPQKANDFIYIYDSSSRFITKPVSFTIDIPKKFLKKS